MRIAFGPCSSPSGSACVPAGSSKYTYSSSADSSLASAYSAARAFPMAWRVSSFMVFLAWERPRRARRSKATSGSRPLVAGRLVKATFTSSRTLPSSATLTVGLM